MENTNCGENCCFVTSGFCKTDKECPFYVETWWRNQNEDKPKLVCDCFPQKFVFEQNNLLHRLFGVQAANEQLRNRVANLEYLIKQLLIQNQEVLSKLNQDDHQNDSQNDRMSSKNDQTIDLNNQPCKMIE